MPTSTENLKQRRKLNKEEEDEILENLLANADSEDSDEELPLGGRIFLARKKKADSWACIAFQVFLVIAVFSLAYYAYYYFEHMHVSVIKAYANLGYDSAQHELANRYLHGSGVERHPEKAMEWFKKAADQGNPNAAYNLAVGHLKGYKTEINRS